MTSYDVVQPRGVRAAPVDAGAGGALHEPLLRTARARLQPVGDVALVDVVHGRPARGAAGVRRERQLEAVEHVGELVVRVAAAHERGAAQRAAAQQAPVLGEQEPVVGRGLRDEGVVAGVVVPGHVDAEQAQAPGERAEVHVEQQPRRPVERLRARAHRHLDDVTPRQPVGDRHGHSRDAEVAHLGEGYADGLHDVPDRRGRVVGNCDDTGRPPARREQGAQAVVDGEPDDRAAAHDTQSGRPGRRRTLAMTNPLRGRVGMRHIG